MSDDIKLPPLPRGYARPGESEEQYFACDLQSYARAAVRADRARRAKPSVASENGPLSRGSAQSVSPSFNVAEHQAHELASDQADRMETDPELFRVDMGVLGELYVRPEIASARFAQLKRERAPVKAVYPMYQGAALPNDVRTIAGYLGRRP